jgi:hypothetical protein
MNGMKDQRAGMTTLYVGCASVADSALQPPPSAL